MSVRQEVYEEADIETCLEKCSYMTCRYVICMLT